MQGDIKVDCPYVLPSREISTHEFVAFCQTGLGVPPQRILRDIQGWIEEDAGHGDQTAIASAAINRDVWGVIVAKHDFALAGLHLMAEVFRQTSGGLVKTFSGFRDGDVVRKGEVVLAVRGASVGLLLAERTSLNISSRLSGITTKTLEISTQLLRQVPDGKPVLLETRKTTPGLRLYEKYATRLGGARNHRHGLDAGAMLKENHLRASGNIVNAIRSVKAALPVLSKLEVEVTNLEEFRVALTAGADVVMLDNFGWDEIAVAVRERNAINAAVELEISGNLDAKSLEQVAKSGVDYASMGALVHKAVWVDMSMQLYS
jgi:nicotinate-nucleotide pyrophosphorylase (carboxylating)